MKSKERIIRKIQEVENPKILEEVELWLDAVLNAGGNFSSEEIDSVKEGYSQYLKEDLLTDKEAEKIFEKWVEGK